MKDSVVPVGRYHSRLAVAIVAIESSLGDLITNSGVTCD